ncbi:hypothetical protein [Paenibacillus phage SV21]|nr:hypothetical protein [Paenibacillus phage SV21]
MKTVVLYKWENLQAVEGWHARKGFSFEYCGEYGIIDCCEGKEYVLPEGYELSETIFGETAIFDNEGYYCFIEDHRGLPLLRSTRNDGIVIKEVA